LAPKYQIKIQEMPSGASKMHENLLAAEVLPTTPLGSLQRSPDPLAAGEGADCPSPQEPTAALGPSGLALDLT